MITGAFTMIQSWKILTLILVISLPIASINEPEGIPQNYGSILVHLVQQPNFPQPLPNYQSICQVLNLVDKEKSTSSSQASLIEIVEKGKRSCKFIKNFIKEWIKFWNSSSSGVFLVWCGLLLMALIFIFLMPVAEFHVNLVVLLGICGLFFILTGVYQIVGALTHL